MKKSAITMIAVPLVLSLLLSACATPVLKSTEEKTPSPQTTIAEAKTLEKDIENARQEQVDVLSPNWFARAETSFEKAKSKTEKGAALPDIRKDLTDAATCLNNARQSAAVARSTLALVIESRRLARTAGAPALGDQYTKVEKRFLKLTGALEKDRTAYASKQAPKVSQAFRALELIAIKNTHIGQVEKVVQQAEESDAEKHAPLAFETALRHLNETDAFITANRYATDEIQKKAETAMFFAKRSLVLTDLNKQLKAMTPQETSLWVEGIVEKITSQLQARDSRDLDMESQVANVLDAIATVQESNKLLSEKLALTQNELALTRTSADARIQALNQALASYQNKSAQEQKTKERMLAEQKATERKLEAEREFNQKFVKIQNYFRSHEAEVYKRGYQLVIRLKGMRFPIGQAVIMPDNYQLLGKVQRAIGEFDNPSAVIEGHTDSTGPREVNDLLSKERANAVKKYLIANGTLPADKIASRGYGSEKPLASNETPEGRAANRRIDVIVTPGLKPGQ